MTIWDFADSINKNLIITRHANQNSRYTASFQDSEIKRGSCLESVYGQGSSALRAIDDYWEQIQGKRIIFNAMNNHRQEFTIPINLGEEDESKD